MVKLIGLILRHQILQVQYSQETHQGIVSVIYMYQQYILVHLLFINPSNEGDVYIGNNSVSVDITNDRVGIGTTTPTQTLDVSGNTKLDGDVTVTNNLVVEGSNTLNTINRQTYTFTTTDATPYIETLSIGGNVYGRYIKAIVIGNSNVGSLGGEFVKFYDRNGFAPSTTQIIIYRYISR